MLDFCVVIITVGFHRYVLENFNGLTLDGVKESEVAEFDAPSEVREPNSMSIYILYTHTHIYLRKNPSRFEH